LRRDVLRRTWRGCRCAAFAERLVVSTALRLVHQDAVRLGQLRRADCRDFLKLVSEVLDLVGMIPGDFFSERPLDLVRAGNRRDAQQLVVGLQRF
jgi:hypothetical protein